MLVADVMTTPVVSVARDASLEEAVRLLSTAGVSALPVVDDRMQVVGILSEADVLREPLPPDPRAHLRPVEPTSATERTVADVMTPDAVCAKPHTDCAEVALALADTGWKSMPVVDDGRLVGMVSRSDIVHLLAVPDVALELALRSAFAAAGHPDWEARAQSGHVQVTTSDPALGDAALATAATVPGVRSVELARPSPEAGHGGGSS